MGLPGGGGAAFYAAIAQPGATPDAQFGYLVTGGSTYDAPAGKSFLIGSLSAGAQVGGVLGAAGGGTATLNSTTVNIHANAATDAQSLTLFARSASDVLALGTGGAVVLSPSTGDSGSATTTTVLSARNGVGSVTTLVKRGAGSVAFDNVQFTHVGGSANDARSTFTINVNEGKLLYNQDDTALASLAAVNVANGATLGGTGTLMAPVSVAAGGILAPGTSVGTLTLESLSLDTATLAFELDGSGADKVVVSANNGLAATGVSTFTLSNLGGLTAGTYTLIDYAGTPLADLSNFTLSSGVLGSFNVALVNNTADTRIDLSVSTGVGVPPGSGTWSNASADGKWTTNANWNVGQPSAATHIATFDGTVPAGGIVNVDAPQTIGGLVLNNANGYTLSGSTITLDNGASPASITLSSGSHTISAGVTIPAGKTASVSGTGVVTISGVQSHGAGSTLAVAGGTVNLDSNAGEIATPGNPAVANLTVAVTGGQVKLGASQALATLSSTVVAGIDLNEKQVWLYTVGDEASIHAAIGAGQIIDSTKPLHASSDIGIANRNDANGQAGLLLRLTRRGDATCDGIVNFNDLLRLSQNYNTMGRTWDQGDFTYDGTVNFNDLLKLSQNYNQSFSSAQPAGGAAVPEPGVLGILAVGAMGLLTRRRGRRA